MARQAIVGLDRRMGDCAAHTQVLQGVAIYTETAGRHAVRKCHRPGRVGNTMAALAVAGCKGGVGTLGEQPGLRRGVAGVTVGASQTGNTLVGMRRDERIVGNGVTCGAKGIGILAQEPVMWAVMRIVARQTLLLFERLMTVGSAERPTQVGFVAHQAGAGIIETFRSGAEYPLLIGCVRVMAVPALPRSHWEMDIPARVLRFQITVAGVAKLRTVVDQHQRVGKAMPLVATLAIDLSDRIVNEFLAVKLGLFGLVAVVTAFSRPGVGRGEAHAKQGAGDNP